MFITVKYNMSGKLSKKHEILRLVDNAGVARMNFLEELELVGQMPFSDEDYKVVLKKFGIIQEVKKDD